MKSSIHLFYGIIIGILLVACTGSLKEDKADKAEFEIEKIVYLGKIIYLKKAWKNHENHQDVPAVCGRSKYADGMHDVRK